MALIETTIAGMGMKHAVVGFMDWVARADQLCLCKGKQGIHIAKQHHPHCRAHDMDMNGNEACFLTKDGRVHGGANSSLRTTCHISGNVPVSPIAVLLYPCSSVQLAQCWCSA